MTSLTLGIPALNEEKAIESVVNEALKKLPNVFEKFEILMVNDGSIDQTGMIMDKLATSNPKVRVIHHPYNLGFRGFVNTLINNAKNEWLLIISGDGECDIDAIHPMFQAINNGYDVVIARRVQKPNYSIYRHFISFCYNKLVKLFFQADLKDIGGVKIWRTSLLKNMNIISTSAFMNAERLIKFQKSGFKIGFVQVIQKPRLGGKQKGASFSWIIGSIKDMIRVFFHLHFTHWKPSDDMRKNHRFSDKA